MQHVDIEDWRKWINYINQNYRVKWFNGKTETFDNQIDYDVMKEYFKEAGPEDACSYVNIFIDKIQINCHFFCETEIENDIDPSEIKSFEDHKKILKYMTDIATILNKKVILTLENMEEIILIKV